MSTSSLSIALIAGLLTFSACATASTETAAVPVLHEGDIAPDGSVVSCRATAVIGTRFKHKDCKSELAWKEFDEITEANARESTDKFQRLNSGCSTQSQGTC